MRLLLPYFKTPAAAFCTLLVVLACTACRTVDPAAATQFGTAAGGAKHQAELAFDNVNALTRSNIIARAATQEVLNDDNFFFVLPAIQREEWIKAFSILEEYGTHLSQLSSFKSDKELQESLVGFGEQLSRTADFKLEEGILVGVAKLGGKIIEAKARNDARKIAQSTDPEIQVIMGLMAEAIGSDDSEALRGTVKRNFNQGILNPLDRQFLVARQASDTQARLGLAERYGLEIDHREEIDQMLASLRRSVLDLAKAHQALAQGRATDVLTFAKMIADELADAKSMLEERQNKGGSQ